MYYNPKRKRLASFNVNKKPKYIKGDDDYFNIALRNRDDTNIYTAIVNDIINNDYIDNYDERNKTFANERFYHKEEKIEEEKEEKKEGKKEVKKKRRNTNQVGKIKEKTSKKDVIIKEEGKTVIKTSGAKSLKELLG